MVKTRAIQLGLVIFAALLLSACNSNKSKVGGMLNFDTDVKLTFNIAANINPDDAGDPAPLILRLYELRSDKMFAEADFIELYERDKEVLGADFMSKTTLKPFVPGQDRVETMVLSEGAQYIGLYAEFLQYKDATFKAVIPVVRNNVFTSSATIRIEGNDLQIIDD